MPRTSELSGDTEFVVVIPARRGSTRLSDKMLADIGGIPLVIHTARRAEQSSAKQVWVATDDKEIAEQVEKQGCMALMTDAHHPSGTDRIAEAVQKLGLPPETLVVNLQGDEPFMLPDWIDAVAKTLEKAPDCVMASACYRLYDCSEIFNPNVVKVVISATGYALYFSRAAIPWVRGVFGVPDHTAMQLPEHSLVYRHVGLYAYRVKFLQEYHHLPVGMLESCESLEQLRILEQGYRIAMYIGENIPPPGVDTQADLNVARLYWEKTLSKSNR